MVDLSLEEAYRKWSDDLGRYATVLVGPADAADVVADAVVSILRSDGWDRVVHPRAYLFAAVLNSARMGARAAGRRRIRDLALVPGDQPPGLASDIESRAYLETLSVAQRAVVYLTYWEDLAPGAVAEILGVSDGTVRRHLARARAKLREVVEQ